MPASHGGSAVAGAPGPGARGDAARDPGFNFCLANSCGFLYDGPVARDREVPRREFLWPRAPGTGGAEGRRDALSPGKRGMANPFEFIQQVRAEAAKVIWPTRRETLITTAMVLLMVVFTSLFFTAVDAALHYLVGLVLGIGRRV